MGAERTRELARFAVVLAAAGVTLAAGELTADRLVRDAVAKKRPADLRAPHVLVLPDAGRALPPAPPGEPFVLLLGNSHTYALPSLEKGRPLILDPGVTLVDRLEAGVREETQRAIRHVRLSYPNFLPLEMLARVGYLLGHGYDPAVVVLGVTYRNIARDTEPRASIQQVFRDPEYPAKLRAMLQAPEVGADPAVLAAIDRQVEEAERALREERMRSDADRVNEHLIDRLEEQVTLLGRSRDLRVLIYRWLTFDLQESFATQKETYLYDAVPADLELNRRCLFALLRLLRARGATVLVYLAPERSDLPPLVDPAKQAVFVEELARFAAENGVHLVDLRGVVPADQWGWMLDSPDRSHFSESGHVLLGARLVEEGKRLGVWRSLVGR